MELYIQPQTTFEKHASEVSLPEDANAWPTEILQELYKQVPYIADFEPNITMSRVDAEQGYGLGHVIIRNSTQLPQNVPAGVERMANVQTARIPIIIKERRLQPLDVIVTSGSKPLPLTEERLRQALFRPTPFDVPGMGPGDDSILSTLYPPQRLGEGLGGEAMGKVSHVVETRQQLWKTADSVQAVGTPPTESDFHVKLQKLLGSMTKGKGPKSPEVPKVANAKAHVPNSSLPTSVGSTIRKLVAKRVKLGSLLLDALPHARPEQLTEFKAKLAQRDVQAQLMQNAHVLAPILQKVASYEPSTAPAARAPMDFWQVSKTASGYRVRSGDTTRWDTSDFPASRGDVVQVFGTKVAFEVDTKGSVTVSDMGVTASPEEDRAATVTQFGYYKVQTTEGTPLKGYVFPNVYDANGTSLPLAVFSDGTHAAFQDQIVGELQTGAAAPPLTFGPIKGHGCFVRELEGSAEATLPFTVLGSYEDPTGHKWHMETATGEQLFVSQQPNLKLPVRPEADTCLIPDTWKWLSLGESEAIGLISEKEAWGKEKTAGRWASSVTVRAIGPDVFSFEGPHVEKVAHEQREGITLDDALFLFGGLGTDLAYGATKLAESYARQEPVQVRVGRSWGQHPGKMKMAHGLKSAWNQLDAVGALLPDIRADLLKEAAFIADPRAVDTVLSLGFVSPENIQTFVTYLPRIEETQSHLCELLIAARLGVANLPIGPLEKAVRSVEAAISGLKVLAFQTE